MTAPAEPDPPFEAKVPPPPPPPNPTPAPPGVSAVLIAPLPPDPNIFEPPFPDDNDVAQNPEVANNLSFVFVIGVFPPD